MRIAFLLPFLVACDPELPAELLAAEQTALVAPCSPAKLAEVRAPATFDVPEVEVACHLTLSPGDRITKRIVVAGSAASGTVIDCNRALLDGGPDNPAIHGSDILRVLSLPVAGDLWDRPENVTIKDCDVIGSIKVRGWEPGELDDHESSRRDEGHPARARAVAPRAIRLENLVVKAVGKTPLYVGTGVSELTLVGSTLGGRATSVAIYLDQESTRNVIRDNVIETDTGRELIAVDGSDWNRIYNNRFAHLEDGGIYFYRNCGERGTVRHTAPTFNQVINNRFYYDAYTGPSPAVWLGANDGRERKPWCDDDRGLPFGSSADDRDFARRNVILDNQIVKRSIADMIRTSGTVNKYNLVAWNRTVAAENPVESGCHLPDGLPVYIRDGQVQDVSLADDGSVACAAVATGCDNGEPVPASTPSTCAVTRVPFACRAEGRNEGCAGLAVCPVGTRPVGARAACNLEVGDADLAAAGVGWLAVSRASDRPADGVCRVAATSTATGKVALLDLGSARSVGFSCAEHDVNGGDCHIRGELVCR